MPRLIIVLDCHPHLVSAQDNDALAVAKRVVLTANWHDRLISARWSTEHPDTPEANDDR